MHRQQIINKAKADEKAAKRINMKLYPQKDLELMDIMAGSSFSRASNWSKQNEYNEDAIRALKEGLIPLQHPTQVEFRLKDKSRELHKGDIIVRNYMKSVDRVKKEQKDFQEGHLGQVPYLEKGNFVERKRKVDQEMGPSMRYGLRGEGERLSEYLNGPNRQIDHTHRDTEMIHHPDWKPTEKKKWMNDRGFDLTTCTYGGLKSKEPWVMVKGGINIGDTYTEGFEVVGDIARKRDKKKEMSTKGFLTTVTPTHFSTTFIPPLESTSLRSHKSMDFFKKTRDPSDKIYPKTFQYMMNGSNSAQGDSQEGLSPLLISPKGRPIQIKSRLESFMESPLTHKAGLSNSNFAKKKALSIQSPTTHRATVASLSSSIKKGRNSPEPDHNEYIRHTVGNYFDE